MNYRILLFFFLILSEFTSHALIIESSCIQDLLAHLHGDTSTTLIIFDIDNTVAESELGSDQWFAHVFTKKLQEGWTIEQAQAYVVPLYTAIQHHVDLTPVEPCTPYLIAQLQDRGITLIACTARGIALADRTITQLASCAIDFTRSAPHTHDLDLTTHKPGIYKNGIVFCDGAHKEVALLTFFERTGYRPHRIIFIDDKSKYLTAVEQAVTALGIEFIGIRYGHVDHKVHNFDHAAAEKQLEEFLAAHEIVAVKTQA